MSEFRAADLAVVIPTRERWDILAKTLSGLGDQTVSGFETIVVVDGTDQSPPPLDASRVLVERRAGPATARNAGTRSTGRPLVLFLGDDTIPAPDLVERHLAVHRRHPRPEAAAVGFVGWHPSVASNRINRWLEWSGMQSWYASLAPEGEQEVSHWYFYTSNLSLKRSLLLQVGGFDEDFPFAAFEDLECGLRLSRLGLRLYYEPAAVCHHLHAYDWPALERRFATMALSERLMVDKHPDIEPGCLQRIKDAEMDRVLPLERIADMVPARLNRIHRFVRWHADRRYLRRLAPGYREAWDRAVELCELRRYLGHRHDSARVVYGTEHSSPKAGCDTKAEEPDDELLFEMAHRALSGNYRHAISALQSDLPRGSRVLDYRCGIGSDGLALAQAGYSVVFADYSGPTLTYLRWRLAHRGLQFPVHELGADEIPRGLDAAVCLDAASGHDPTQVLRELEQLAPIVALGFPPEAPGKTAAPDEVLAAGSSSRLVGRRVLRGGSLLVLYRQNGARR